MLPFIYLLKKHNFPALPEDIKRGKELAGRDEQGNKGILKPLHELGEGDSKLQGGTTGELVRILESMPVLTRKPGDPDYKE